MSRLLTPQKMAEELNLGARYVRRLARQGCLEANRHNGRLFIDPTVAKNAAYIEERKNRLEAERSAA